MSLTFMLTSEFKSSMFASTEKSFSYSIPSERPLRRLTQKGKDVFAAYKWKNRILIIKTLSFNEDAYQTQKVAYKKLKADLKDRDMIILAIASKSSNVDIWYGEIELSQSDVQTVVTQYFSEVKEGQVLIGKDGGLKVSSTEFIDASELFAVIDSMPMRRSEASKDN